jgi:hypothetical protein
MRCASDWIYLDFQPGKTALLQSRIDGLMPGTGARNISWSAEAETSVFFHGFRVMDLALIVLGHAVVTWPAMPAQPVLTSLVWPGWLDRRLHGPQGRAGRAGAACKRLCVLRAPLGELCVESR